MVTVQSDKDTRLFYPFIRSFRREFPQYHRYIALQIMVLSVRICQSMHKPSSQDRIIERYADYGTTITKANEDTE